MVFHLQDLLLCITSIANVGLLWFVYGREKHTSANTHFSLFIAFTSFWGLIILLFRLVDSESIALYLMKLSYVSALLLAYFFYQFSLNFIREIQISHLHKILIQTLVAGVGIFLLVPNVLTLGIVYHDWGKEVLLEPYAYWIFTAVFVFFFLTGLIRLFWKIPFLKGVERLQLEIISITILIGGIFGMYYNLVLPSPAFQNFQYIWSGPIFTFSFPVIITYTIFRFKVFNPRAILAELLVCILLLILFIRVILTDTPSELLINSIVLAGTAIVGGLLIKGVNKEVRQRQQIEHQQHDLQNANERQTNLIHIMNHQIKGYLSKSKNIFAELLTGDYGQMPPESDPLLKEGLDSLTQGVEFVQGLLNGSSADSGTLIYNMVPLDFKTLVAEAMEREKGRAEGKHLEFKVELADGDYNIKADKIQLKEAVRNLIENSTNYTPEGSIHINLSVKDKKILLTIKDTGVGISAEDKLRLFQKGGRGKDSLKINVNSTGYGLSFVKAVVIAHDGRVWAESEGTGKGSTFYLELPTA